MEDKLKIENLISEKEMAKALGIPRATLQRYRRTEGCPWLSIGGRAYFHGQLFMEWILKNRLRTSDPSQTSDK
jgi:hypothetical protein